MDELLDWSEKQQILDNSEISDFHPDRDDRKYDYCMITFYLPYDQRNV
jgi:hypothetical protein